MRMPKRRRSKTCITKASNTFTSTLGTLNIHEMMYDLIGRGDICKVLGETIYNTRGGCRGSSPFFFFFEFATREFYKYYI